MNVTKKPGMTARISGRKTRLSTGAPRKPTWRSRNHTNTKQDQFKGRKLIQFNCKAFKCYLPLSKPYIFCWLNILFRVLSLQFFWLFHNIYSHRTYKWYYIAFAMFILTIILLLGGRYWMPGEFFRGNWTSLVARLVICFVWLSISLSVWMSVCLDVWMSVCLSVWPNSMLGAKDYWKGMKIGGEIWNLLLGKSCTLISSLEKVLLF